MEPPRLSAAAARRLRALHRKKERRAQGRLLVEGLRLVDDLTLGPWPVEQFLFANEVWNEPAVQTLRARRPEAAVALTRGFAALAATEHPQGVLAVARYAFPAGADALADCGWGVESTTEAQRHREAATIGPRPPSLKPQASSLKPLPSGAPRRLLILAGVQDPGNAGTLIRSAAAFGWDAVLLLENSVEAGNPKVLRAAMGGAWRVAVVEEVPPEAAWSALRAAGFALWAADAAGEPYQRCGAAPARLALVIGGEARGVGAAPADAPRIGIPMAGGMESLNAAMAGTVLMAALGGRFQVSGERFQV